MDLAQVLVQVFGIAAAFLVAWIFGDLAAARTMREYEELQEWSRKRQMLRALLAEIQEIRETAKHNAQTTQPNKRLDHARPFIEFRLSPFDAVFSGQVQLPDPLLSSIVEFVAQAQHVNSSIRAYERLLRDAQLQEASAGGALIDLARAHIQRIDDYCAERERKPEERRIPELAEALEKQLKDESETHDKQRPDRRHGRKMWLRLILPSTIVATVVGGLLGVVLGAVREELVPCLLLGAGAGLVAGSVSASILAWRFGDMPHCKRDSGASGEG